MQMSRVFSGFHSRSLRSYIIISILLSSLSVLLYSNIKHHWVYSAALRRRYLSLGDFSPEYVATLNDSIRHGTPLPFNNTLSATAQIPRIIHQTYKTSEIPERWSGARESCQRNNPSYTHYFWTDDSAREFIRENFNWFMPTYDSYPYPIQRVDSIRYFLLWHYGGIYIDLDISCRRPLDPLLEVAAWVPKTQPYGVSNDLMASRPGHPLMLKLAMDLQDHSRQYLTGYTTVFWSTGPMFVNNALASWFRSQDRFTASTQDDTSSSTADRNHVAILPPMFYDKPPYTFFGHVPGSSWHGDDVAVAVWLYRRLWLIMGAVAGGAFCGTLYFRHRNTRSAYKTLRDEEDNFPM